MPNEGFYGFFWQFRAARHIQERIAPKPCETDMHKLHMKFSALNTDFDGSSRSFLGSRKPEHKGIKERYRVTVVILPLLASHGHAAYHNKQQWWAFQSYQQQRLWKTLNFQNKEFYWFLWSSAAAHTPRMNCDEMAGDRLTVCKQELP